MQSFFSLPIQTQLSHSLSLCHYHEMPILLVQHPTCRAAISLHGGHLLAWQPAGNEPVIWLSEQAIFQSDVAIRGGIPVCWPWFGKAASPSHGFARTQLWTLTQHQETDEHVVITLQLTHSAETRTLWDHEFALNLTFKLGKRCNVELHAAGNYESTAALHTYFQIGDIQTVRITGLGNVYKASPNTPDIPALSREITFNQETDQIYTQSEAVIFIHDKTRRRTLKLTHQHASDIVVWNPWEAGAKSMKDMPDDGYKSMVCVETARIHSPLISTPNSAASFDMTIEVLPFVDT